MKSARNRRPVILLLGGVLVLSSCSDMCRNETVSESVSPDGRYRAVVFTRDCGATTDYSTQVSILPASSDTPPRGIGNTFVCAGGDVGVDWTSGGGLMIHCPSQTRVFKSKTRVRGVDVTYDTGLRSGPS